MGTVCVDQARTTLRRPLRKRPWPGDGPDYLAIEQPKCLPALQSAIESSEWPAMVIGRRPSGRPRMNVKRNDIMEPKQRIGLALSIL